MATDDVLMAQGLADAVGATKAQVQAWTDAGVLLCREGTDRRGTGRQRIYDTREVPFAALAVALAAQRLPAVVLHGVSTAVRLYVLGIFDDARVRHHDDVMHTADWYRRAWAGRLKSFLLIYYDLQVYAEPKGTFPPEPVPYVGWGTRSELPKMISIQSAAPMHLVVDLKKVLSDL